MTPSRLQFTIKMLNVLIIFKNYFFLTFILSQSVWNSDEIMPDCHSSLFITYHNRRLSVHTVLGNGGDNAIQGTL